MSSNAFARSRPKVRHQRVAKTHSCDHPRFLQLVNELARLNEIKKKQEESEGGGCGSNSGSCSSSSSSSGSGSGSGSGSSSNSNSNADGVVSSLDGANAFNNAPLPRQAQAIVINYRESEGSSYCPNAHSSASGSTCCNNVPQTSNGYRSLDTNQINSALNNHYHHQQQNHQGHNQNHHHRNHHNQSHHHQHHSQHEEPQSLCNNMQPQHDDRCASKNSSSSFGYSKQNLVVEQNNPDFSNSIDLDLRQDENRSKRKRSANDSTAYTRKNSMLSCPASSGSGASKKLKSSSDAVRPLSPSFTKCPICLLDCMDRDPSFTNTCFHLFCYVCIENWTKNKATCPLCRTKFTKIIYSIKSPTNYEEKHVSPIRTRDDDEGFTAERLMFEHLSGLNPNSNVANRISNSDDVQFLFEHVNRNSEVLLPQYYVNQVDPRQETLHAFNTVTANSNFASNVPPPFTSTSYPMASNYILFQPNRIPPTISTAITGAYTSNTSLTNINNDIGNRRASRSGRYSYRNYESPVVDSSSRATRTSNSNIVQSSASLDRHHHNQHQHQHQNQHHHQTQHRSSLDMGHRQNQRIDPSLHIQLPSYPIPPRHYNPNAYPRRYNNTQVDQHLIDSLSMYRQMPDM